MRVAQESSAYAASPALMASARDAPVSEQFAQALYDGRRCNHKAEANAGEPEELAERAQHDEALTSLRAGIGGDAESRVDVGKRFIDDQVAVSCHQCRVSRVQPRATGHDTVRIVGIHDRQRRAKRQDIFESG